MSEMEQAYAVSKSVLREVEDKFLEEISERDLRRMLRASFGISIFTALVGGISLMLLIYGVSSFVVHGEKSAFLAGSLVSLPWGIVAVMMWMRRRIGRLFGLLLALCCLLLFPLGTAFGLYLLWCLHHGHRLFQNGGYSAQDIHDELARRGIERVKSGGWS